MRREKSKKLDINPFIFSSRRISLELKNEKCQEITLKDRKIITAIGILKTLYPCFTMILSQIFLRMILCCQRRMETALIWNSLSKLEMPGFIKLPSTFAQTWVWTIWRVCEKLTKRSKISWTKKECLHDCSPNQLYSGKYYIDYHFGGM